MSDATGLQQFSFLSVVIGDLYVTEHPKKCVLNPMSSVEILDKSKKW